ASSMFMTDGFALPEAKSNVSYVDDNTILFGTDLGNGTLTKSGYPRIVKLWKRGTKVSDAKQVAEGAVDDVALETLAARTSSGNRAFVLREPSFFETEYFAVQGDGTTRRLPLPLSADVKGAAQDQIVFTLRKDWTPEGVGDQRMKQTFQSGSLLAFSLDDW